MKRISHLLRSIIALLAIAVASQASASVTAASILSDMRARLAKAKAVEAMFTLNGETPVQGTATMSGVAFMFDTPQMAVWYDGKTQWAMLKSSGEVSITEPTADELTASNPFAILNSYQKSYKARRLSDSAGRYRVELTPLSPASGIKKIIIFADKTTKWPAVVEITFNDARKIELTVDSFKSIPAVPATKFRYDAKHFPATEIIDLR